MRYATYAQLVDFLPVDMTPPAEAEGERLMDRASELLAEQIRFAVYVTNSDGDPTDATVLTALRNAACAQVEYWLTVGDEDDDIDDVEPSSISLGPLALNWGDNAPPPGSTLAPRARRILGNAGLLEAVVSTEPVVLW